MATATFSISNVSEGESWSQSMSGFTSSNRINLLSTYLSGGSSFVTLNNIRPPGSLLNIRSIYGSNSGGEPYFTWREFNWDQSSTREYGHSLDLWSSVLYTDIVTNNSTWDQINNKTYFLSNNKYSLVYFYTYDTFNKSAARPIYWSRGGSLTVTVSQQ